MSMTNISFSLVSYYVVEKRIIRTSSFPHGYLATCKGEELIAEMPTDEVAAFVDRINEDDGFIMGDIV